MPSVIRGYNGEFGEIIRGEAQQQADLFTQAIVINGIPRWTSNNRIPPIVDILTGESVLT